MNADATYKSTVIQQVHFDGHPDVASLQVASARRGFRVRVIRHDGSVDVHPAVNVDGAYHIGNILHDQLDSEARVARMTRIIESLTGGGSATSKTRRR